MSKKKVRKGTWKRNLLLIGAFILTIIYLGWRILFTLPLDDGIPEVIFGVLLINAEVITCTTTFELYYRKIKADKVILDFPIVPEQYYPDVDVFIATHNEPLDILYKTANACTFMEYPDKNKVHIYFCDDGNRETVEELARTLGIGYLGLADNKDAKSGNLNNALEKTNSPLIATFDADMIPQRTFLMKTVPYFFLPTWIKEDNVWRLRREDELDDKYKIGLIQTPQSFYNPDLFQYNLFSEDRIPNEQDFFSREVNIMRNSSNAIAYTGSNTLIARQAMMDIGGFPLHTITEDFETSVRIQQEKYITYATDEVQAAGLTTTDFGSMIKQRKRWAQGVIQSLQNTRAIFSRKLTFAGNITYLTSYLYWWSFFNRIIFILAPIMFALFDFRVVDCTFEQLLIFWLPSYCCYSLSFRFLSSNVRSNRWSQTIDTIFAPYLIWCVILESLGIHERKFKVTTKKKEKKEHSDFKYAIPHIILIVLSVLAIIRFTYGKYGWALIYSSIIIFWLCYNLISLTYAVFFMMGRRVYRKAERIRADEEIQIYYENTKMIARTIDLSDEGLMFKSEEPLYIPVEEEVRLIMENQHYKCEMLGTIVYVKKVNEEWHYAMSVQPVEESDKRNYMQFIYDRTHSLPTSIDAWATMSDDMVRNIKRRMQKKQKQQRRKLVRISIEKKLYFVDGCSAYAHDFNYEYISLSQFEGLFTRARETYRLRFLDGIILELQKTDRDAVVGEATLYKVMNLQELSTMGVDFTKIVEELQNY